MRTQNRRRFAAESYFDPAEIGEVTPPAQIDPNEPYLNDFDQRTWSELSEKYQSGQLGDFQSENLAVKVAALAKAHPELRPHLIPLLRKHASQRKVAHKPTLAPMGLNRSAVASDRAFMVYKIDAGANNSKFYEGLIVDEDGGYRVLRRYGALTDSVATGNIVGAKWDHDPAFWFPTLNQAQRQLMADYKKRIAHGYTDAFGPYHQTPEGKKLPQGEYPVGLTRQVGFGWGTQSITGCIPALRELQEELAQARSEIALSGRSDIIKDKLDDAMATLTTIAHADSSMAAKLKAAIGKSLRRLSGSPRFLPDTDGRALAADLATIQRYVTKQLSLCN